MSMDPASRGGLDSSKCRKLSMEENRELIYEISKRSDGAPQLLKSWNRQELVQILNSETGKERKYTGWAKSKMIEHLLKILSEKAKDTDNGAGPGAQPEKVNCIPNTSKRQRKADNPSRLPISTNHFIPCSSKGDIDNTIYCQNLACTAILCREDEFCKDCSCFICHQYDESKDPSVWLVCSSMPHFEGNACGMSCHIECALKHKRAGISESAFGDTQDGSFHCINCNKANDLLRCYRKLLMRAKEAKFVGILCSRLFLSQELLKRTEKYHQLRKIVDDAIEKLEAEVGPIAKPPVRMEKGIISKLSSVVEVHKLCASALETLGSLLSCDGLPPQPNYDMPDAGLSNPSEGNSHNRSTFAERRETPENSVSAPSDEYLMGEVGSLPISTITSTEDNRVSDIPKPDDKQSPQGQLPKDTHTQNGSIMPIGEGREIVPFENGSDGESPTTKRKLVYGENDPKDSNGTGKEQEDGGSSKKRRATSNSEFNMTDYMEKESRYCVEKIKWLKDEGYMEKNFRVKFLTWYSFNATPEDKFMVRVYIETMIDDPVALVGQLVDSFARKIFRKKTPGCVCAKFWH